MKTKWDCMTPEKREQFKLKMDALRQQCHERFESRQAKLVVPKMSKEAAEIFNEGVNWLDSLEESTLEPLDANQLYKIVPAPKNERFICKYAIIRFLPFIEKCEFANIGIVLFVPNTNEFYFKLLPDKAPKRILDFFKSLKLEIYSNIIEIINDELNRIQELSNPSINDFEKLIQPRTDCIQYSKARTLFSYDVESTLNDLFNEYVG